MSLNWTNDPLLIDKKPVAYNNWVTANTLIDQKEIGNVINDNLSFANIYGIMIRRIDFVRTSTKDRIIARFPFLFIDNQNNNLISKNILLVAELVRDYFYKSINKSIKQWKIIIETYLKKKILPFPIIRCCFELIPSLQVLCNKTPLHCSSARGETFTFPTKLSHKLAYLCGICNGDGNLRDYWIIVADETKKHIEFISQILTELFSKTGKIMKTGGAWIVKLNLLWAVRLFNFLTSQAIDKPKYDTLREPLIFQLLGDPFRSLYWRGAFDADGSFKHRLSFSTASKDFAKGFQDYLSTLTITSKIIETNQGANQLEIPAKYKWLFARKIGTVHYKKMNDFFSFLSQSKITKSFIGINQKHLTSDKLFFDFSLLPNLQVIGLDDFLTQKVFPDHPSEFYWHNQNKGISIHKLLKLSNQIITPTNSIMTLLNEYKENILFRSSNSQSIRLPLQPTSEIQAIMSKLVPTVRGAVILDTSENFQALITGIFSITPKEHRINHRLVSKFLSFYGLYQENPNLFSNESNNTLKTQWIQELE